VAEALDELGRVERLAQVLVVLGQAGLEVLRQVVVGVAPAVGALDPDLLAAQPVPERLQHARRRRGRPSACHTGRPRRRNRATLAAPPRPGGSSSGPGPRPVPGEEPAQVAERRVASLRVGRFIRFDSTDVAEWLRSTRVPATTLPTTEISPPRPLQV
jgi:hypothetical protein